jgi:hypothetical protein
MGVLKGFLFFCAGAFALAAVVLLVLVGPGLISGLGASLLAAVGWAIYRQAARFAGRADEGMALQFEATVRRMAEKNGGVVSMQAILNATGEAPASAQAKMRALAGRGVCELDFGPNGEMQFKLTPGDEARATIAAMAEKNH